MLFKKKHDFICLSLDVVVFLIVVLVRPIINKQENEHLLAHYSAFHSAIEITWPPFFFSFLFLLLCLLLLLRVYSFCFLSLSFSFYYKQTQTKTKNKNIFYLFQKHRGQKDRQTDKCFYHSFLLLLLLTYLKREQSRSITDKNTKIIYIYISN